MAEAQELVQRLLVAQNADGGWPHLQGTSWLEPTAFAALALHSNHDNPAAAAAISRSTQWLLSRQKPSGGWAPHDAVNECTSVSSVAALAILFAAPSAADKALSWTAGQVYRDELSFSSLLSKVFNTPPAHAPGSVPWYPGTAGWVTPTALTALALFKAARERNHSDLAALASASCSYLLSRRCIDQGWNHGGSKTRSDDARSYPETTGIALLALRAGSIAAPSGSLALAKHFSAAPQSIEGLSWLQLAVQTPDPPAVPPARTVRDIALRILALSAAAGNNILLNS